MSFQLGCHQKGQPTFNVGLSLLNNLTKKGLIGMSRSLHSQDVVKLTTRISHYRKKKKRKLLKQKWLLDSNGAHL